MLCLWGLCCLHTALTTVLIDHDHISEMPARNTPQPPASSTHLTIRLNDPHIYAFRTPTVPFPVNPKRRSRLTTRLTQRSRLTTRLTQRQSIRPYPRPCLQLAPHARMDSHCDCRSLRSSGGRPSRLFWRHELTHFLPTGITLASSRASGRRARTPRAPP
jgi:hypothetical protein